MKVALLISTYNWPKALNLVFKSIANQSKLPDEVLIADDGSKSDTKELIDDYRNKISSTIHHVWHEDIGFRKGVVLNKALALSKADYIIQIDGDCILHEKCVEDHLSFAEKGLYLYGTRVHIKQPYVSKIEDTGQIHFSILHPSLGKRPRRLRIPFLSNLSKKESSISKKLRGCNMSFWKEDIVKINGFNEDIHGWGREDSEMAIRLHNIGVQSRRMKFKGLVFHLDHTISDKSMMDENSKIQNEAIKNKITWAGNGLDKYL
ncbi:glycosyltransferase family 2 protein [Spongiivirga citrea]|uniref:Glycosyltransferase n=1 Tax=Spongiivirga citrea TaxID=1481457 RepID=A0A6M0CDR5_9FLAO|nr:glycosyltransferase family 2 protein [Spongiivirga citrea]NER15956.1 glycosyltransferase [Spongiivirga citrea]